MGESKTDGDICSKSDINLLLNAEKRNAPQKYPAIRFHFLSHQPSLRLGSGMSDELRPELEMHGVEVPPLTAPNEAVFFKNLNDFYRPVLSGKRLQCRGRRPFPISAFIHIEIDRVSERMIAEPFGPGDEAPTEGASQ